MNIRALAIAAAISALFCVSLQASPSTIFEQAIPLQHAHARIDAGGLQLQTASDLLELRTAAWGRDGDLLEQDLTDPRESGCAPGHYRIQTVSCPATLERPLEGGVERWTLGGALEQSWTLHEIPGSSGPIVLEVEVEGADLALEDETAVLTTPAGNIWTYGMLEAWDAVGKPLDSWLEVDGNRIRIMIDDTDARWPIEVDPILSQPSITLTNTDADYGIIMSMGDANNDGKTDLLVGARFGTNNNYGQVFLYLGNTTSINTSPTRTYTSGADYGKLGEYLSMHGDINGDGYDDAVLSEYYSEKFYVVLGGSSGLSSSFNQTITGPYGLGHGIDIIGDWNHDGYDDVIVGTQDPSILLYKGSASGLVTTPVSTFSFSGPLVSGAGDTNKDTYDEVAYCTYQGGTVYIMRGASSFPSTTYTLTISGMPKLCSSLARGGDVNGDGYADLLVGDSTYSSNSGRVVVFYGSSSGLSSSNVGFIPSPAGGATFGETVRSAGDVNGDGYDDVAVADNYDHNFVYIFHGSASGILTTPVNSLNLGSSNLGYEMDGGRDLNRDGYDDLAIGDFASRTVYLYYGCPDTDHDGYCQDLDCNDNNSSIKPNAQEICDSIDNDCDGLIDDADSSTSAASKTTWYRDADGDGYGKASDTKAACSKPTGYVADKTDCDDTKAAVNPAAQEVCDSIDNDCDGLTDDADTSTSAASKTTWYRDADGDGYGKASDTKSACSKPTGYVANNTDCDDTQAVVSPAAQEVCDSIDNDCDGLIDDADTSTSAASKTNWYRDADGDGYGKASDTKAACSKPTGYVTDKTDCDDTKAAVNPAAQEVCDSIDNDCDGLTDDADSSTSAASKTTWYRDADGDGYGKASDTKAACSKPTGYVANNTDCDDTKAAVNPAAQEVCDSIDNDCDGLTDDADSSTSAASKTSWYRDADGDGYGKASDTKSACSKPTGYVNNNTDCDDTQAAINPAAQEICDSIDNDCDSLIDDADTSTSAASKSTWYRDADGDGYGKATDTKSACSKPTGYVADPGATDHFDCDDTKAAVNPAAQEVCDSIDNDCDSLTDDADTSTSAASKSTWYRDADVDGYGNTADAQSACSKPTGYVAAPGAPDGFDCDDTKSAVNPAAQEICDSIDNDCDGLIDDADTSTSAASKATWYRDADGDGYGDAADAQSACSKPTGYVADPGAPDHFDCDDTQAAINPAAQEVCDNIDNDCDGQVDEEAIDGTSWYPDSDGDGYGQTDGTVVSACTAPTGTAGQSGDCNDADPKTYPGAAETGVDGIDHNCDGEVDVPTPTPEPVTPTPGVSPTPEPATPTPGVSPTPEASPTPGVSPTPEQASPTPAAGDDDSTASTDTGSGCGCTQLDASSQLPVAGTAGWLLLGLAGLLRKRRGMGG